MTKDLISLNDLNEKDFCRIFDLTKELKAKQKRGKSHKLLEGKTLGMIFTKPSTRTRVSFEVGIFQLGGSALYLNAQDLQLGTGETIADTAKVLSRYLDGIMIRTFDHQDVVTLAQNATIPVINGLTDLLHPCQVLADLFTILEYKGKLKGLKLTFIGDGNNNVTHSLLHGCSKVGMNISLASPEKLKPQPQIVAEAKKNAELSSSKVEILIDPQGAIKNADIVVTDTWVSMGRTDAEERKKILKPYQLNSGLLVKAKPDAIVMHCLPAHRGDEITDEVMDGPKSVIWDEAENRLHVQKALMVLLMK